MGPLLETGKVKLSAEMAVTFNLLYHSFVTLQNPNKPNLPYPILIYDFILLGQTNHTPLPACLTARNHQALCDLHHHCGLTTGGMCWRDEMKKREKRMKGRKKRKEEEKKTEKEMKKGGEYGEEKEGRGGD